MPTTGRAAKNCSRIERDHPELSVRRQCALIGLSRSSLYYQPVRETAYNLALMRLMGLQAVYPKPRTSRTVPGHKRYPCPLSGIPITRPCQVWSSDITYVPSQHGFMYLAAIMDYAHVSEVEAGLQAYFQFYNYDRPHQSLNYQTPAEVHFA